MKKLKQIGLLLLPFFVLGIFLMSTDPYNIPLPLLVVPFILVGFGIFRGLTFTVSNLTKLSKTRIRLLAGLITSLILLVVLLQSIRQLSLKDFFLLVALLFGLTFYLRRV
jgi:hypothetical protein